MADTPTEAIPRFDPSRECNILNKTTATCPRHGYSHAARVMTDNAKPTEAQIEAGLRERDKGDHGSDAELLSAVYLAMRLSEPDDDAELAELKVFHGAECNRYTNGQCSTRRCLVRGGWTSGAPDYDLATCEAHETILALDRLQAKAPETPYCGIVELPGDEAPEAD